MENFIVIRDSSYNDIKKALLQWIELYTDDLTIEVIFELYKINDETFLIKVDKRIENEDFNYLVNYLCYPEDFDYTFNTEGYTVAKNTELYPSEIIGKKLQIYVPGDDKEYDIVYAQTEDHEVYKIEFRGKVHKITDLKAFNYPKIDVGQLSKPEKIKLSKVDIKEKQKKTEIANIEKRFKIIPIVIGFILLLNILSLFVIENNCIATITSNLLIVGLGVWFYGDYKMLQINKYYNFCILFAISILVYANIIDYFLPYRTDFMKPASAGPLSLLIFQKPLRLFFIRLFKREPIVDKFDTTYLDYFYMVILLLTLSILPIIINDLK